MLESTTTIGPLEALGTVWYIECFDVIDEAEVKEKVVAMMTEFGSRYSRFRSDSWVSQLNQERCFTTPDPEFVHLLQAAISYYEVTNGVFDIMVGEKMVAAGYDAEYSFQASDAIPHVPELPVALTVNDDRIDLHEGQIDLGGFGKGWLIDKLTTLLKEEFQLEQILVNGGGDMYVGSESDQPIPILLQHPEVQNEYIGRVHIRDEGFAASSPFVRAWQDKKTKVSHNHLHTTDGTASYVVAPTAALADMWATTLAIAPDAVTPLEVRVLIIQNDQVLRCDEGFELNK